mgnify:CR=1 FL=1
MFQRCILFFLGIFILGACAAYEPQYRESNSAEAVFPSEKTIEKTFYLVGDAGLSPMGGLSDGLTALKNLIRSEETTNDYTIYLGDNIYPDGMPEKGEPDRRAAENAIDAQINALKDFEGEIVFIPGNHDWYNNGLQGLNREAKYLKEITGKDLMKPSRGCPIETELEKHQNKTILFAMHHPMFSYGTHGGNYALKKHLYPLQKKIPMPGLASLVAQIRSQGGVSVQDRYNELYNELMKKLAVITKKSDRLVFASGHEHTMHHIENDGLIQIQTGTADKDLR